MIRLKSCPRCQGDMIVEAMLGDVERVCLQCGYRPSTRPEEMVPSGADGGNQKPVAVGALRG